MCYLYVCELVKINLTNTIAHETLNTFLIVCVYLTPEFLEIQYVLEKKKQHFVSNAAQFIKLVGKKIYTVLQRFPTATHSLHS